MQQLTGGKVASSGLSLSKREWVVLEYREIFLTAQMVHSYEEKNSSKLGPMAQPYIRLALVLPDVCLEDRSRSQTSLRADGLKNFLAGSEVPAPLLDLLLADQRARISLIGLVPPTLHRHGVLAFQLRVRNVNLIKANVV